ncbi:MAG: hypothetical protein Q4C80_05255 [Bacillota bacterium]|nr:hypothetical protein [Bacillota bacterium]
MSKKGADMKKINLKWAIAVMLIPVIICMSGCGNSDEPKETQGTQTTGAQSDNNQGDELYKEILVGDILAQYPSGWIASNKDGTIFMSKDGSANPPFITIENMGWVGSPGTFVTNEMNKFKEKYGNRVASPPEAVTDTVAGIKLAGFTGSYSSKDGRTTITRCEMVEVINDVTYLFTCEYVSNAYGDQHEDETTYFEYRNAIETMKIKSE